MYIRFVCKSSTDVSAIYEYIVSGNGNMLRVAHYYWSDVVATAVSTDALWSHVTFKLSFSLVTAGDEEAILTMADVAESSGPDEYVWYNFSWKYYLVSSDGVIGHEWYTNSMMYGDDLAHLESRPTWLANKTMGSHVSYCEII